MSETPWTKGKWEVVSDLTEMWTETWIKSRDEDGSTYIICADILSDDEARLISCAPDLYEALDDLLRAHHHSSGDEYVDAARAILAKARGETKDP